MAQAALVLLFLWLGFTVSVRAPLLRGRDELAHFRFIRFIAQHGRLPVTWAEREAADYKAEWPPLFHLLAGLAGQGIDLESPPFIEIRLTENNPRTQLVFRSGSGQIVMTEDPYQGEILLWYLGRWLTVLSGLLGAATTYWLVRTVYPANTWLALSGAAFLALIPNYVRISGLISYDPLLAGPLAIFLLLLFRTVHAPNQNWRYLTLGLLMGVAGLVKYTPLLAAPIIFVLVGWLAYRHKWTWPTILWRLVLFGLGVTATFGSWLLYTEIYFNQIAEQGWVAGLLHPFVAGNLAVGDQTSQWFVGLITTSESSQVVGDASFWQWLWVLVGNIWEQAWLGWLFVGMLGVALSGVVYRWPCMHDTERLWTVLLGGYSGLIFVLPALRFFTTGQINTNTVAGQHVVFPLGPAIVLLLLQGLQVWLKLAHLTGILVVVIGLSLWQDGALIARLNSSPLPVQSVPLKEEPAQPLVVFGQISLVKYDYLAEAQALRTVLYWRAEAFLEQDYEVELTLFDADDKPQAQWLGHPVGGLYPTRAWTAGDRVRDVIEMPLAGLPAGEYTLRLRMLNRLLIVEPASHPNNYTLLRSALPPTAPGPEMRLIGDSLLLGRVNVSSSPPPTSATLILKGRKIGYWLWQPEATQEELPVFQERSTIVIMTPEILPDEINVKLIGPDGQAREPAGHTGQVYNFVVEPHFAGGAYRLSFEQQTEAGLTAQVETEPLLRLEMPRRQFEPGPIAHPLEANFAGQAALLGYDLPRQRIQAGEQLPLTLHWQALRAIGADLITFNRLLDQRQDVWGGQDRRVRGVYTTFLWAPGEIVTDPFFIQVDPETPDGIYHLAVGLYLPVGQAPVSLPLLVDGHLTDVGQVTIGPIKVGGPPPGLTLASAAPQVSLNQPFGDAPNLTLLGYDLETARDAASIKLYWRSEAPLMTDYTTFVHVLDEAGGVVAQKDQPPLGGAYPTSLWDTGEIIADEIVVPLLPHLPAGDYRLAVGLYEFQSGQRLVVPGSPNNSVLLKLYLP
jgi:4-amino-4-deoxy-L-arabinose transferase-like glycosyltransferase